MLAVAIPILPGKLDDWKNSVLDQMTGENKTHTDEIRENAGVHERSFLQETTDGHLVIFTFEGENPVTGWKKTMANLPPESAIAAMELHGLDVNAPPPPLPKLVYDSKA